MPVSQVNDATPIEKNHVYVISPAQLLKMNDGYLAVLACRARWWIAHCHRPVFSRPGRHP